MLDVFWREIYNAADLMELTQIFTSTQASLPYLSREAHSKANGTAIILMTKRSRLSAVSTHSTPGVPAWSAWLKAFVFVTAVFLSGIDPGFAQVNNWIGPNGNWSTAGNWSLGVPVQADSVVVDNGTTTTVDTTFTIQNLTIGDSTANSTVQIPNGVLSTWRRSQSESAAL